MKFMLLQNAGALETPLGLCIGRFLSPSLHCLNLHPVFACIYSFTSISSEILDKFSTFVIYEQLFLEMKQMGLKNGAPRLGNEEMPEDWELRRVPAGPDPLHHNGQDPKKPRTP
ncbi:UNVERIFIED_CONTAM: hypothetical protein Slati_0627500 [Sesamum latifolium]|uniref:Uncharacterized protein n=1 Tax=Sesamum latifolium TaxID=2727402 RepID=A0AAW2Y2J8_9LAMI